MNDKNLLAKIGLSVNEAEIYLTLLRLGPMSAYEIAKKTGIYRPHVYDKLDTLARKSLASYVQKGKKKIFSAAPPSKIMDYLKEQENDVKQDIKLLSDNMQNLTALYSLPKEDTRVQVFTGVEGLKLRIDDTYLSTPAGGDILIFGLDDSKYNEALPVFLPQHFKRLKEKRIRERVITQKKKFMFNNGVTSYRFLDTKQINPTNTIIYGGKVSIVIWGTPITSIIIENKKLADTYREHFEFLWRMAEKSSPFK